MDVIENIQKGLKSKAIVFNLHISGSHLSLSEINECLRQVEYSLVLACMTLKNDTNFESERFLQSSLSKKKEQRLNAKKTVVSLINTSIDAKSYNQQIVKKISQSAINKLPELENENELFEALEAAFKSYSKYLYISLDDIMACYSYLYDDVEVSKAATTGSIDFFFNISNLLMAFGLQNFPLVKDVAMICSAYLNTLINQSKSWSPKNEMDYLIVGDVKISASTLRQLSKFQRVDIQHGDKKVRLDLKK